MQKLRTWLVDFLRNDDGPTAVEYALLAVLILCVVVVAVTVFGQDTSQVFNSDANKISSS